MASLHCQSKFSRCLSRPALITFIVIVQVWATSVTAAEIGMLKLAQLQPGASTEAEIDLDPPQVTHLPVISGIAGATQIISVNAKDDQGVAEVTVYYRNIGEEKYRPLPMSYKSDSQTYTASITTTTEQTRLEYYFVAVDTGGNKVLSGFPYQPFKRFLSPSPVTEPLITAENAEGTDKIQPQQKFSNNNLLLGVVAILAVGALASASKGGSSDAASEPSVPVVVTVPLPR